VLGRRVGSGEDDATDEGAGEVGMARPRGCDGEAEDTGKTARPKGMMAIQGIHR
jgi:hypothetical protein